MLKIVCCGTPYQIGVQHGETAKLHISRSIIFYKKLFQQKSKLDWEEVKLFGLKYQPYLKQNWPQYVLEMEGVASGAGVTYPDILSLNVRTEIAFGAFNDGCTALSWTGRSSSILAQNWDWNTKQAENLIWLKIQKDHGQTIQMITEAGIIGKIGMNSQGVGCTLNAIKAKGVSFSKLPCHLALRVVMESESREAAVALLKKSGVASACHITVGDVTGGSGLECSSEDVVELDMNKDGILTHTNHYLTRHNGSVIESPDWLPDTRFRLRRINELLRTAKHEPSCDFVETMLKDELEGSGAAICRAEGEDTLATLFSIVMDLGNKKARVAMGRPTSPSKKLILNLGTTERSSNKLETPNANRMN